MAANMSTEETFQFIELYQTESCLWNPKNKNHKNRNIVNDSWKRIADTMGLPVHELKKKKDNLLTTFRINLKRKMLSLKSGAGVEDVYQPIWIFYDAMEAFLKDVYDSTILMNTNEKTQSVWIEEASTSSVQAGNIFSEYENDNVHKCSTITSPELQETSREMSTAFAAFNSVLTNMDKHKEEDECDLFCKMLAKQIKAYPKLEREEIMYELHGVMINKRRQYEGIMK